MEEIWNLKLNGNVGIGIRWVQGHAGIPGNEKADQEAKTGSSKENIPTLHLAAYMRSQNREARAALFEDYWYKHRPESYKDLDLNIKGILRELELCLLAERTGYGDYTKYYERFHHDKESRCACGEAREVRHILRCRRI
ncbi:hypothetical protein ACQKWADRAFT_291713 [Trichoderma austrokoningii]